MKALNPATGELIKQYTQHTDEEVTGIVNAVDLAYAAWSRTDFSTRRKLMLQAAQILRREVHGH